MSNRKLTQRNCMDQVNNEYLARAIFLVRKLFGEPERNGPVHLLQAKRTLGGSVLLSATILFDCNCRGQNRFLGQVRLPQKSAVCPAEHHSEHHFAFQMVRFNQATIRSIALSRRKSKIFLSISKNPSGRI